MFYIKCTKCGHFNEVKTEYMVFCSNCHKKLETNYSDWTKLNPDKTFDDYKQIICTTEINVIPVKKKKAPQSKRIKFWIGFALTFAIFYAVGQIGGEKIVNFFKSSTYDKTLMLSASEINKTCPIMIDAITRLDNTIALPGNVFQYNYTLISLVKDSVNIEDMKKILTPKIANFVKSSPEMKSMRDNKTTIKYYYRDKVGVYLFDISVDPGLYQN
jgi:hypothetical protein